MKKVTFMLLALLCSVVTFAAGQKKLMNAPQDFLRKSEIVKMQRTLPIQGLDRKAQTSRKAVRRAEAELVTPPAGATVETYYTAGGTFYANGSNGWVNATSDMESINVAIDGQDMYIQGLAYWFKNNWLKGTIDGETVTFPSGQLIGTDEYGDEFIVGSDDLETTTDIVFAYDSEEGTLTATTAYIFESAYAASISAYCYWANAAFSKEAPEGPEVIVAPEGLVTEPYIISARNYKDDANVSGSLLIGFDGNDVYVQGLCTYLPEAWLKGTLDGTTITFATGQYLGSYSNYYDMFLNVLMGEDVVFDYDAEAGTLTAQNEFFLIDNSSNYFDSYRGAIIKKVFEQAAMPANPEITNLADGNYGWYFDFNVPLVDTEGNGLVASKLSYMIYTDVEGEITPLTFTPETHTRLTEEMTEIPYGFTENYDFYNSEIYLNDLYSKDWNKLGIQSIYYGGDETNATEIQWYDIKPYATPGIVWVAAEQGYEHQQNIEEIDFGEGVTATLLQNSASTAPRYWSKDQTLRTYAGNTITITSAEQTINKIEFTFPLNASEVALEADKGDYERTGNVGTWTGEENEVTFTSGKAFISQIAIYLGNGEVKLVELPEDVEPEVWTIDGTFEDSYSSENIVRATEAAIVGNTIYVKGIPFYFEEAWMKGTIDAETGVATFKSGQFVGEDSYGQEFMIGSDDGQTICDIEFLYDAEEKTLTQLTSYIVENADTPDEIAPYGWWYDMVIYAGEPVIVEPVEAPEGLETSSYLFTAHALENGYDGFEDYSAQLQVGFDGQDVYFQGFSTDFPNLWVKGTLSEDGKTVTIPANQYMGQYSGWFTYNYYFTAVDPETYELTDVVLNYDAETNTFSTDQLLALNGNKRSLDYYLLYTNVNITKLIEVAATPADPEILDFVGTGTYPKVKFDIPAVDTEGNPLITAKLFYTVWVEKNGEAEQLTIKAEEYDRLEEDMVEIPYNYDDNWDIYAGGATVYLNQSSDEIQSWTKIGVQSIYTAAGETNKSNVVWMDLTQYWETTGIAEVKNDGKKAVIFNMQGQKLNSVPAKGLYIMNNRKYVVK